MALASCVTLGKAFNGTELLYKADGISVTLSELLLVLWGRSLLLRFVWFQPGLELCAWIGAWETFWAIMHSIEFHSRELFNRDLSLELTQENLIMKEFYVIVHTVPRNPFKHSNILRCVSQIQSSLLKTHPGGSNHIPSCERMRGDSLKLHQGRFRLDIGNNFFS